MTLGLPSMPRDVSAEGWRIDRLLDVTLWFVLVLAALGLLWLLWAAIVHRDRPGRSARPDRGASRRAALLPISVAAFVFLVVDGNLLYTSTRDLLGVYLPAAEREGALRIEVNAHQWAWEFRYAGRDGRFATPDDVIQTDHLVIPADRPVALQIGSSDVVHSFHLPNLRVKRDAVPGRLARVGFTATETGDFDIACAEFCGVHHHEMRGVLTVLPAGEFSAWLEDAMGDAERIRDEATRAREEEERAAGEGMFPGFRDVPAREWGWPWE